MQIIRPTQKTRAEYFKTRLRDTTRGVTVTYASTIPDPRITAEVLDQLDAMQSYMSIRAHYLIRMSGMVEIGRDPNTLSSHRHKYLSDQIVVQLVGGLDPETGHTVPTATKEQLESLEELLQMLADTLNTPLEVDDKIAAVEEYHAARNGAAYSAEDDDDHHDDDDLTDSSEGNNLHDHQIN